MQRVNKLVSVAPLVGRYSAQLGDVVVGRVAEIIAQRWKLDICAQQDAILQLSAVNLPGSAQVKPNSSGVLVCCFPRIKLLENSNASLQRRRTIEDELNMRTVFSEGELLTAEVQSLFADHSVALHTRSAKYGQVGDTQACDVSPSHHQSAAHDHLVMQVPHGQLVKVPAGLLRRRKQQLVKAEELHVNMTLGLNGYILVSPDSSALQSSVSRSQPEQHRDVALAAAAVRVLAALGASVDVGAVSAVSRTAADAQLEPDRMMRTASLRTFRASFDDVHT